MNHEVNLSPAELVIVNRVRMAYPSRLRDRLPSDAELVSIIKAMTDNFKLTSLDAIKWMHEAFLAMQGEMDEWEQRLMRQRVMTYWAKEVGAGT